MKAKENISDKKINKSMRLAGKNNLPASLFVKKIEFDHAHGYFAVLLRNGSTLFLSLKDYPSLKSASPKERENYSLLGGGAGIHWEDVDEDLSVRGLLIDYARVSANILNETFQLVAVR